MFRARKRRSIIGLALSIGLLLALHLTTVFSSECPQLAHSAFPKDAHYVPESEALQLNRLLESEKRIRLEPRGNYLKSPTVYLKTGYEIYGLGRTLLPKIIVRAGTRSALLSDVATETLIFEGADLATSNNCFNRISTTHGAVQISDAKLENNLFTDVSGKIAIDTRRHGYIKDNLFIRTMVHSAFPAITIIGDPAKKSMNNLFVWTNILTPHGDGIIVDNQKDISFIGIDAEAWNWRDKAKRPGMMNVSNTDFLSVFMATGGNHRIKKARYFNLDAQNIFLQGTRIERQAIPGISLGPSVENILTVGAKSVGMEVKSASTQVIEILKDEKALSTPFAESSASSIQRALELDKKRNNTWMKPKLKSIPDPAGSGWKRALDKAPDSSEFIQSLVDSQGIARLEAKVYYIAKPIRLKDGQGIVGASADHTAIIAKSGEMDIIVGADHLDKPKTVRFVLADVTLQGGRNGINHSRSGSGGGAVYNKITVSHVTFREMSDACILLDSIHSWDNNFIDNVNFYKCKTGIKQRPDPLYIRGNRPGMTFMDKNVFYRCQFEECETGIDMAARRANNLNAFIDCQFKENRRIINQKNSTTIFANSIFVNNEGEPAIESDKPVGIVNSSFSQTEKKTTLFGSNVLCNSCSFDLRNATSTKLVSNHSHGNYFVNTESNQNAIPAMRRSVILNSHFGQPSTPKSLNVLFDDATRMQNVYESRQVR